MQFSEIVFFGIVWGGLMIYFLTPFNKKTSIEIQESTDVTFSKAFKNSLTKLLFHNKAILALLMLMITLIYIWMYYTSIEWYFRVHGEVVQSINPMERAFYYMISIILYTAFLYLFLAFRKTIKLLKKPN
ncbi:hypothetical protein M3204_22880 [Mesobacillus subterraneus]|uniref:hypothetical protein n=1 Tax=Mesobacillus subterraneus TaxID=285983 RepID=UPI0020418B38|nr:hypothetical protein [Mesobacillus subterraneus]MCM3667246.1 hypothetical protein [Mesobacillus subterraneus]MCM3686179.1 hypothetical protein [Mesobacillus subterraneus]